VGTAEGFVDPLESDVDFDAIKMAMATAVTANL
jgi:hypothetical protein